jgi:hypothetical protein
MVSPWFLGLVRLTSHFDSVAGETFTSGQGSCAADSPVPTNSDSTNWIERLLNGDDDPAITSEQAEAYLRDLQG